MNRDKKKFWGKNVSICIGLYAISICPAHGQILQKCYQGQFNFKALSQRGTENGRDRRRRERSEPGDLQGRACCRAERACGIGIRDEDTPPRGNAASSGTRSASAAFCVQNTGGSGYRQDRASVIRRPRKQCFAEQRRGGGAVAGALRMEAVKIAQLHEGADDPNVETCRRHAASCRGEYGLSLRQHALPPVPQRKCALRTRYHSGPGVELTLRVAHEAGRSETPPPFLRNCRNLLAASSSGSGFRREGCGAEHRGGSQIFSMRACPIRIKKDGMESKSGSPLKTG